MSDGGAKVDPRIAHRRRLVAERLARSRVKRSLLTLLVLAGAGSLAWFLTSPHLSVESVVVEGANHARVADILAEQRVVEGRPLLAIRVAAVEEALGADPWVDSASVKVVFPKRIEVRVRERRAVAWTRLVGRWGLLAGDGVLVEYSRSPDSDRSLITIPIDDPGLGAPVMDENVSGALRFLDALPADLAGQSIVQVIGGELWASVGPRPVRLGLPVDMDSKAASLLAVIDHASEGVIDVTAPARPAVRVGNSFSTAVRSSG